MGKQTKFCSVKCARSSHFKTSDRLALEFKKEKKKGNKCKYCKDSDHIVFCCNSHRMIYREIRKNIEIEMARRKPKPSEKQLKNYSKIEYALMNRRI